MYGVSTAWATKSTSDVELILQKFKNIAVSVLELEYRITEQMWKKLILKLREQKFQVVSLHNFCPLPNFLQPEDGAADALLFSSLDEEERKLAVKYGIRTLQQAHELEVQAVVFHFGRVEMDDEPELFYGYFDRQEVGSENWQKDRDRILEERRKKRQKYLDAVLFSLEQLNREAEKLGVFIGVENRVHVREIPSFDDFAEIFARFDGGRVRFWYDVGHARVLEVLGFLEPFQILKAYHDRLIGVHFHDVRGYGDHWAPGQGEVDFKQLKSLLSKSKSDYIKVIEVHDKVSPEELVSGIQFLQQLDYFESTSLRK